jgi:16S rRNA (adenine1518-N6/adenine1519-N6)-dimethyltransferase
VPSPFPRTTLALRAALQAAGLAPDRRRGQCFLTDAQAVDAIVRDAGVGPGDRVVEVGTGPGLLTHALCEAGAEVFSFEVDGRLQALARELREWPSSVRFEVLDVMAGKHRLSDGFARALEPVPGRRTMLVSNLPYGIATPLLLQVLSLDAPPARLVVMVQLDVAEKLLAPTGGPEYGAPSAQVRLKAKGRILRRFGPEVFWPRPRVRSAVLELEPLTPSPCAPGEHEPFARFLVGLFSRRRKVLPAALRAAVPDLSQAAALEAISAEGLDAGSRPQELAPERLLAMFRRLHGSGEGPTRRDPGP